MDRSLLVVIFFALSVFFMFLGYLLIGISRDQETYIKHRDYEEYKEIIDYRGGLLKYSRGQKENKNKGIMFLVFGSIMILALLAVFMM